MTEQIPMLWGNASAECKKLSPVEFIFEEDAAPKRIRFMRLKLRRGKSIPLSAIRIKL